MLNQHKNLRNHDLNIPEKANRVLNLVLIFLLLIVIRIWHLSVIQHETKSEEFKKPQRKIVIEPARRATIRDRFNIPLAINKMQYQASIQYSQFRDIPSVEWVKGSDGKRIKQNKRKDYITKLTHFLAKELNLDAERLEDLIYSKAAFYYHLPFIIKDEISEKEFYRLKAKEKDFPGLVVRCVPKRVYPKGKVAGDLIGYMGAINREEYESIIAEIKALEGYLQDYDDDVEGYLPAGIENIAHARARLKELQERAYSIVDSIGKTGIEGRFDEFLRGYQGRKAFYSDAKGNFLRELPGSKPATPGKRLILTISSELQEYAEQLLAQNERIREAHLSHPSPVSHSTESKQPWIKGGAIVAIEPNTGEILALASYPRIDPNDFIPTGSPEVRLQKTGNISKSFESLDYIGQVWDQKRPLERERFDDEHLAFFDESLVLTWDSFIDFILPKDNPLYSAIKNIHVQDALEIQRNVSRLIALSQNSNLYWIFNIIYNQHPSYGKKIPNEIKNAISINHQKHEKEILHIKKCLDPFLKNLSSHYEKVLLVDLCRLVVDDSIFDSQLIFEIKQDLNTYHDASAAFTAILPVVKSISRSLFHDTDFKSWRSEKGKDFLKQKRQEEKIALIRYPRPYIDYLDEHEEILFNSFWEQNKWEFINSFLFGTSTLVNSYTSHFTLWENEIKNGAHSELPWYSAYCKLKKILSDIPQNTLTLYMKTLRGFNQLNRPLYGKYRHLRKDSDCYLEKHLAAAFYPKYGFGYGRSYAYRQAAPQGSIFKLVTAYAALAQHYQKFNNSPVNKASMNPMEIIDTWEKNDKETILAYSSTGKSIPQYYKGGRLIKSQTKGIGKVDIIKALEVSSNPYFSLLAGEYLNDPEDLVKAAKLFCYGQRTGIDLSAEIAGRIPTDLATNRTGLYSTAIGQHTLVVTPLQTSIMLSTISNGGKVLKPKIVKLAVGSDLINQEVQFPKTHFEYKDTLAMIGIDFPLFFSKTVKKKQTLVSQFPSIIRRKIFMPNVIREMLLEGMSRVMTRMHNNNLNQLSQFFRDYPEAISDYIELKDDLVGKTSTSESVETIDLDPTMGTNTYTHIWFGGISFDKDSNKYTFRDKYGNPELVVVVYLRFGKYGRDTAPIAAQIIKKWRELVKKDKK